jgi:hypothetical protein
MFVPAYQSAGSARRADPADATLQHQLLTGCVDAAFKKMKIFPLTE